jgi:hypothetical protein
VVRFVVEFQVQEPEVAAAIILFVGGLIAALITAIATIRSARIQASHQHPSELPPPRRKRGRRRRTSKEARSP